MKKLISFLLAPLMVGASTVTLSWDANSPSEQVQKYYVYQSTGTNAWVSVQSVTNPIATLTINAGVHRFRVTASNAWGESLPSAEVSTPAVATPPQDVIYIIIQR